MVIALLQAMHLFARRVLDQKYFLCICDIFYNASLPVWVALRYSLARYIILVQYPFSSSSSWCYDCPISSFLIKFNILSERDTVVASIEILRLVNEKIYIKICHQRLVIETANQPHSELVYILAEIVLLGSWQNSRIEWLVSSKFSQYASPPHT